MTGKSDKNNKKNKYKPYITKASEYYLKEQIEKALKKLEQYLESVGESYESLAKNDNTYARKLNKTLKEDLKEARKNLKFFKGSAKLVKGLNLADLAKEINRDYEKYGLPKTLGIHGLPFITTFIPLGLFAKMAITPVEEAYKGWAREMDSLQEVCDSIIELKNNFKKAMMDLPENFDKLQNTLQNTSDELNNLIDNESFQKTLETFNEKISELPEKMDQMHEAVEKIKREREKSQDDDEDEDDEDGEDEGDEDDDEDEDNEDDDEQDDDDDGTEVQKDVYGKIINKNLTYSSGGVIPGDSSQSVPITAHGSEMLLSPSQQAKLFNILNPKNRTSRDIVYSPVIEAHSGQELISALQKTSLEFLALVKERQNSLNNF